MDSLERGYLLSQFVKLRYEGDEYQAGFVMGLLVAYQAFGAIDTQAYRQLLALKQNAYEYFIRKVRP